MFAKLGLRNRILLGYSFPVLLLVVISGLAFLNSQRLNVAYLRVEQAKEVSEDTYNALLGLYMEERAVRSLLTVNNRPSVGDDKNIKVNEKYIEIQESFEMGNSNYKRSMTSAEKFVNNSQLKEQLTKLRQIGGEFDRSNRELINLINTGNRGEALKKLQTLESRKLIPEFERAIEEFEQLQDRLTQASSAEIRQATTTVQVVAGLGTLVAVALTVVISYVLSFSIAKAIQDASSAVTSSVKDITTTVSSQERSILEQSTSVNETTTTIQELKVSALQSAEQAETSAFRAKQALTLAEGGTKTVGLTIEGISELKDQVTAIANQIVRLSEQTSQISTVSDLVANLASQTNMLALNAGVEAARAGEQGKGFAVVAGEIRKLADQSKKSADRINILVNDVQAAINSTIMVTDEGTKKAVHGIKLVAETGDTFTSIADAVNNVFLNTQQITQTAKQQAVAVQRIVSAMDAINLGANETANGVTQVKEVTVELNEAAQNLQAVL